MKLLLVLLLLCVAELGSVTARTFAVDVKLRVYFGTYTHGLHEGISVAEMEPTTGALGPPRPAGEAINPSFLAVHPSRKYLYAVSEVSTLGNAKSGGVVSFAVDPNTGDLTRLNEMPSGGAGPCYLVVDKTGRNVLVANYDGGTVAVLPIDQKGWLKPASSVIQHHGRSINPERQEGPHAHSINLDAANRFAFAADLGLDKIFVYRFDAKAGTLEPNDPPAVSVAPGSGPRHFAFHPSGKYAYVINELANTIIAFNYDASGGRLTEIQTLSTLPAGYQGATYTAEVVVHPSGKFVYGSNRGADSLAIYSVDEATGKLTALGYEPTQGKMPRNFAIDPSGNFLLAANHGSGNVVAFRVDRQTGLLRPTGQTLAVPDAVCIKFVPVNVP
jgi:6-phosphogluconolactonase